MNDFNLKELLQENLINDEVKEHFLHWIKIIEEEGLSVSTRSDTYASSYEDKQIKISTHKNASKNEKVLWDLLHEYGHYLDKDLSGQGTLSRELRAWENAEKCLHNNDLFIRFQKQYKDHKSEKLYSYRRYEFDRNKNRNCKITFMDLTEVSGVITVINVNVQPKVFNVKIDMGGLEVWYPIHDIKKIEPIIKI